MSLDLNHDGVDVRILDGVYLADDKATSDAVDFYTRLVKRLGDIRRFVARKLLDLYNETWLDDDIGEVDEEGFMSRLSNPSIVLYDEPGAAAVYFEDGDLFAGHTIEVWFNEGKASEASIVG